MNDTRTRILDVAEELIQRVGLNAMSYKDISDAVGIRKASIHHHFPKKENLVDEWLKRCHVSYGDNYRRIVEGGGDAVEKLRRLAGGFEEGLQKQQLCFVGMIGSDLNTLQSTSCRIFEETVRNTVGIFSIAFQQGMEEGTLECRGTAEDAAFAFFSFLVGAQIAARAHGGTEMFRRATEALISGWKKR
jgi:TetR/AcrR family transcriptional repressor of nem operon